MLERVTTPGGAVLYQSALFNAAGVRHAFTTRIGGVSERPFDSLNLGNPQPRTASDPQDSPDRLQQNHQIVQDAIGCAGSRRRWCKQVHGNGVAVVDCQFEDGTEADGLITDDAAEVLAIRVADCTPILLSTPDGRAVAAVHAGWRGVVAGIVPMAVARLTEVACCEPDQLLAAIGPCIGFSSFEVGPEVWSIFEQQFGPSVVRHDQTNDRARVDLRRCIAMQLQQSTVFPECIDTSDRCTFTDSEEFFSHRRDHGLTGRMAAMISPNSISPKPISPKSTKP